MMITYNLVAIVNERRDQKSFHIASERSVRVEFMHFVQNEVLGPLLVAGDVVVTCLEGVFVLGPGLAFIEPMTQAVMPEGEVLEIRCTAPRGALELIWAPPFPAVRPADGR
jgi:hypothetical protein